MNTGYQMDNRNQPHPAGGTASDSAPNVQAQLLSVRVQGELRKPAVVMVTSARAGDGKSLTSYLLAASLEGCNHRVSLMEVPDEQEASNERLSVFVEELRSNYDFTVIDAPAFPRSSTVLSLARLVDGILIAVRVGRSPTADDESMVRILEDLGGNVVGVVAAEADTIANYEGARGERRSNTQPQPRRNAENNPAPGLTW